MTRHPLVDKCTRLRHVNAYTLLDSEIPCEVTSKLSASRLSLRFPVVPFIFTTHSNARSQEGSYSKNFYSLWKLFSIQFVIQFDLFDSNLGENHLGRSQKSRSRNRVSSGTSLKRTNFNVDRTVGYKKKEKYQIKYFKLNIYKYFRKIFKSCIRENVCTR